MQNLINLCVNHPIWVGLYFISIWTSAPVILSKKISLLFVLISVFPLLNLFMAYRRYFTNFTLLTAELEGENTYRYNGCIRSQGDTRNISISKPISAKDISLVEVSLQKGKLYFDYETHKLIHSKSGIYFLFKEFKFRYHFIFSNNILKFTNFLYYYFAMKTGKW